MYRAGDLTKVVESKLYLRYDCRGRSVIRRRFRNWGCCSNPDACSYCSPAEYKFGDDYPPYATEQELINAVMSALNSNNRETMLTLAEELDYKNNGNCGSEKN